MRLGQGDVDVVHCQDIYDSLVAVPIARAVGAPLVVTKHFVERSYHEARQLKYADYNVVERVLRAGSHAFAVRREQRLLERAAAVLPVSAWVRDRLVKDYPDADGRCTVVRPAASILPGPQPRHVEEIRRRYCPLGQRLLVVVGRLESTKGADIALHALRGLLDNLPDNSRSGSRDGTRPARLAGGEDLRMALVGEGGCRSALESLVVRLGLQRHVSLVGHAAPWQLSAWYAAADLVVVPSRCEAFGLVVAEALAQARPVVAADVGGITEQITDGRNGLLFTVGDHMDLRRVLRRAMDTPGLAQQLTAQAMALPRPQWTDVAAAVTAVYETVSSRLPPRVGRMRAFGPVGTHW